jgi:replicative superfamily II helicase
MVDFKKLRSKDHSINIIDPIEIFRRLPKPQGINDLYFSQAEVLNSWITRKNDKDIVIKLHTGGGKTLVGLLIAQSSMNELKKPALYLTPNNQLVAQTIKKANEIGIQAVPYTKGEPLNNDFTNSKALMVASYQALFNGRSKFGVRNVGSPQEIGCIVLDDAHTSFQIVRESFTFELSVVSNREIVNTITGLFRQSFDEIDKLGTFDDIISGSEHSVLEIPYWAWIEKIDVVRKYLTSNDELS